MSEIVFYDLASSAKPQKGWSPNTWKTRLALNYKGLPYRTEWLEYPELAPTLKALGVKPNPDAVGVPAYTSPAVKLPSGEAVQDSWPIAKELERMQPEPSLHLDSPLVQQITDLVSGSLVPGLFPTFAADLPKKLFNPVSAEYFARTRAEALGSTLDVLQEKEGGAKAWEKVTPSLAKIVTLLQEHPEGPFLEGANVTYADFILVAFLRAEEVFGQLWHLLDAFEASKQGGRKAVEDLYFASAKWLKRDDH